MSLSDAAIFGLSDKLASIRIRGERESYDDIQIPTLLNYCRQAQKALGKVIRTSANDDTVDLCNNDINIVTIICCKQCEFAGEAEVL